MAVRRARTRSSPGSRGAAPPTRVDTNQRTRGLPVDGRLVGRAAVDVDEQRRCRVRRRARTSDGSHRSPCTVSPSAPGHVIGVGSGRSTPSSSAGAPRRHASRAPVVGIEHGQLAARCGRRSGCRRCPQCPSRGRWCQPFDTSTAAGSRSPSSVTTTRRPKPSSLRHDRDRARRRATTRTNAGPDPTTARRARAVRRARHAGAAPTCGDGPHVQPAVALGDERQRDRRRARTAAGRRRRRRHQRPGSPPRRARRPRRS